MRWRGLPLVVLLLSGCASTETIQRVETVGEAGQSYSKAVQGLLDQAQTVLVDTSSLELLINRRDAMPTAEELQQLSQEQKDAWASARRSQLADLDRGIRGNLHEMRLIARQVALLGNYFQTLENLAQSKAPETFAEEIEKTVQSLDGLSQSLSGTDLFKNSKADEDLAGGISGLVVREVQAGMLRRELERRKDTIAQILRIHEALLAALEAQIGSDLALTRQNQYERTVADPYADITQTLGEDDTAWIDARRKLLSEPSMVQAVRDAADAAGKLRQAWALALENRLTPEDVSAVLAEVEPILAGLEQLRKPESTDQATETEPEAEPATDAETEED